MNKPLHIIPAPGTTRGIPLQMRAGLYRTIITGLFRQMRYTADTRITINAISTNHYTPLVTALHQLRPGATQHEKGQRITACCYARKPKAPV